MHIETLRKHRKSLIKARREIKAKLELLDTLLEEQKRKEAAAAAAEAEAYAAAASERRAAWERAAAFINASIARERTPVDPRGIAALEGADAPDAAPETELSGTGINIAWQAAQADAARRQAKILSRPPPSGVFEPTAATDADDIANVVYRGPTVAPETELSGTAAVHDGMARRTFADLAYYVSPYGEYDAEAAQALHARRAVAPEMLPVIHEDEAEAVVDAEADDLMATWNPATCRCDWPPVDERAVLDRPFFAPAAPPAAPEMLPVIHEDELEPVMCLAGDCVICHPELATEASS